MSSVQRRSSPKSAAPAGAGAASGAAPKSTRTLSVLLVEENAQDAKRITRCIEQMPALPCEVTRCATLEESRAATAERQFDVALVAVDADAEAGCRLLEALGGRASPTALIGLTDRLDDTRKTAALEAGAVGLLSKKALSPELLDNAIRSSLYAQTTEIRLNDALDDLERATRSRSEFFAKIGHDLKTPLNSMIGFSEAIAQQSLGPIKDPKYVEFAEAVHEAGAHLLALIDNLIHLSGGDRQGEAFSRNDLNALVGSAIRMTDLTRRKRGQKLKKSLADAPVVAKCQPSAITQAIINLLTNAIKYTNRGGRIEVAVRETGRHAEVVVSDNGIGMTAAEVSIALRPFGRVPLPPLLVQEGTGLGLPIVREIMARHKGQLDLSSAPGKGTTAILRLPKRATADKSV